MWTTLRAWWAARRQRRVIQTRVEALRALLGK